MTGMVHTNSTHDAECQAAHCHPHVATAALQHEAYCHTNGQSVSKQFFSKPASLQQADSVNVMQASMSALHMKLLVRDYTLDPAQARDPTPVDPSGLISFARQGPDADSAPDMKSMSRSGSFQNKHSSLQVSNKSAVMTQQDHLQAQHYVAGLRSHTHCGHWHGLLGFFCGRSEVLPCVSACPFHVTHSSAVCDTVL